MSTPPEVLASDKPRVRVYRCPHCKEGYIVPTAADGRFISHRGVIINLPPTLFLPRCTVCHKDVIGHEDEQVIKQVLEAEYLRHVDMIQKSIERLRLRPGNN